MNVARTSGFIVWLAVLAAAAVAVWLWRRHRLLSGKADRQSGAFRSASAPPPSRPARWTEAAVLAASSLLVLAISATWPSTGGYLLMLDRVSSEVATASVVLFACAAAGICMAVAVALIGKTIEGAVVAFVVLCAYGVLLNGVPGGIQTVVAGTVPARHIDFTIAPSGTNIEGAELWVNGVRLGKTPYVTTPQEFATKVPFWPEPPEDYETDVTIVPQYDAPGVHARKEKRWIAFGLPAFVRNSLSRDDRKTYYARVRYAGEWGYSGGSSGSGGSGGAATYSAHSQFDVVFPKRRERLERLLDQARLADYHGTSDWFRALETYDEDAWIALRKAAEDEPEIMRLLDEWAIWRYRFDAVTDPDSAWRTFERICSEADAYGQYLTTSATGRAVELLVDKLPADRLVDRAISLLRRTATYGYLRWEMNGRQQFGYSERPGGLCFGVGTIMNAQFGGWVGGRRITAGAMPVAHAVWLLHERMNAKDPYGPNPVRDRIAPEIVRQFRRFHATDKLRLIAYLGGHEVDTFLLRQNWYTEPGTFDRDNGLHLGARSVNKWLYALAYLDDTAGRRFRRENAEPVMRLADQVFDEKFSHTLGSDIDFIFMDPRLAREYWPRFARNLRQGRPYQPLTVQWEYLKRMGAGAEARMFLEAFHETPLDQDDFQQATKTLRALDPKLRRTVADGLIALFEKAKTPKELMKECYRSKDQILHELRALRRGSPEQARIESILTTLRENPDAEGGRYSRYVPLWLEHTKPMSPLVGMLAGDDSPRLRRMALGALRAHPTPAHRALLARLQSDEDADVRAAANAVADELRALAAQPPGDLASDPASVTSAPSPPMVSR